MKKLKEIRNKPENKIKFLLNGIQIVVKFKSYRNIKFKLKQSMF